MLLTAGAVLGLALLAAFFWPPMYRSTGTILIEQQEMPEDFVRSAVSSYADQRIQVISQRVMTSANLLEIISKYNLYPDDRRTKAREAIVANMRQDIKLNMISADVVDPRQGRATKATIAFSVSYENRSPQVAAAVANELTSLYLRENLETRKQQAAGSADFLSTEAQRIGAQVTDLERQLAAFKSKHENSLPEYAQLNVQLASRAQDDLRELDSRVRALDQQIVFLDAQLAQINPTGTMYGDSGQRVMGTRDQLKLLKTQYAAAVATYSPDHPGCGETQARDRGAREGTRQPERLSRHTARAGTGACGSRRRPPNPYRVPPGRHTIVATGIAARRAVKKCAAKSGHAGARPGAG